MVGDGGKGDIKINKEVMFLSNHIYGHYMAQLTSKILAFMSSYYIPWWGEGVVVLSASYAVAQRTKVHTKFKISRLYFPYFDIYVY